MTTHFMHRRIGVLLAASLVLNFAGVGYGIRKFYWKRHYSPPLAAPPVFINRKSIFNVLPIGSQDIVFVGDSQTQQFIFEEYLKGYVVINRGIDGDTTKGILNRIDQIIIGKPKKLFIQIGFNDLTHSVPFSTILKNIDAVVRKTKFISPKTQLYIVNIFPSSVIYKGISVKLLIPKINKQVSQYCLLHHIPYIDMNRYLSDNGALSKKYDGGDGVHLNGEGYMVWTKIIKPYL